MADVAVAEWLNQALTFGRVAAMEARLTELEGRTVRGVSGNKVEKAREGLWLLQHHHEDAIFSGPEALKALLTYAGARVQQAHAIIAAYHSPARGTSLSELHALATRAGVPLQMRFVSVIDQVPMPAIVHLKSEHYSALIARRSGGYVLKDPALGGGEIVVSAAALRDEASGYVLVPTGAAKTGRAVSASEADAIVGHPAALDA